MRFGSSHSSINLLLVFSASLVMLSLFCASAGETYGTDQKTYSVAASRPVKVAQLVGEFDRELGKPTKNMTMSRYGLDATDLGVSFRHNGRTYLLFGDTAGAKGGDAIAYVTESSPTEGIKLNFLQDENGLYQPVFIPGISQGGFEVPMAGASVAGKMYVYHTTDSSQSSLMGKSVVAVSADDGEAFNYLYDLSAKHFINVSIVEVQSGSWKGLPHKKGMGLLMFGSGHYRKSDVRLAYQPADKIESASSICYFDGPDDQGLPGWSCREEDAVPLFDQSCVGELSVTFNRFISKWIMLYNCGTERQVIDLRTADFPWGPWSDPQVIFDAKRDGGYCRFIHLSREVENCDNLEDPGRQNQSGDPYGPYQFEDLATGDKDSTTIYFTMSTWNPYTVVLMKTTLTLVAGPD